MLFHEVLVFMVALTWSNSTYTFTTITMVDTSIAYAAHMIG